MVLRGHHQLKPSHQEAGHSNFSPKAPLALSSLAVEVKLPTGQSSGQKQTFKRLNKKSSAFSNQLLKAMDLAFLSNKETP